MDAIDQFLLDFRGQRTEFQPKVTLVSNMNIGEVFSIPGAQYIKYTDLTSILQLAAMIFPLFVYLFASAFRRPIRGAFQENMGNGAAEFSVDFFKTLAVFTTSARLFCTYNWWSIDSIFSNKTLDATSWYWDGEPFIMKLVASALIAFMILELDVHIVPHQVVERRRRREEEAQRAAENAPNARIELWSMAITIGLLLWSVGWAYAIL